MSQSFSGSNLTGETALALPPYEGLGSSTLYTFSILTISSVLLAVYLQSREVVMAWRTIPSSSMITKPSRHWPSSSSKRSYWLDRLPDGSDHKASTGAPWWSQWSIQPLQP